MTRMAASAPSAMPMPPTRGTGRACTLRASGRSTMPRRGARRIIMGITAMLTTSAVVMASSSFMSARNEGRQARQQLAGQGREARLGRLQVAAADRRYEAYQRAVAPLTGEQVPEQVALHLVFAGEGALALLEPVVDELACLALLDDRAVDGERRAVHPQARHGVALEALDLPAVGGKALGRGMRREAVALRGVVADVEVDRRRRAGKVVRQQVVVQLEDAEVHGVHALGPAAPLAHLE